MKHYLFLSKKTIFVAALLFTFIAGYAQNQTINGNVTWNTSRTVPGDVIVTGGSKLTVNDATILMSPNKRFIVEATGVLNLNGCTLTSSSAYSPWGGIEVRGPHKHTIITRMYGVVNAHDATIENSVFGICAAVLSGYDPNSGGLGRPLIPLVDYDYAGGYIIADDCQFINNYQAASIHSYGWNSGGVTDSNQSKFTGCTFDMNRGSLIDAFVRLKNVYGVGLYGCTFKTSFSGGAAQEAWENQVKYYKGVYATNSAFTITKGSTSPIIISGMNINTKFSNLGYGIYAEGTAGTGTPKVTFSEFNGVLKGIYSGATNNMFVQDCKFDIPMTYLGTDVIYYGIYLDRSTNYVVENNSFTGYIRSPESGLTPPLYPFGTCGVFINESGEVANEIYGNRFERLQYAAVSQGVNVSHSGEGLCFSCNEFVRNNSDISVWHSPIATRCDGIGFNQKNGNKPAGNMFTKENEYSFHEWDLYNECQLFSYHCYTSNTPQYKLIPTLVSGEERVVIIHNWWLPAFNKATDCPRKVRRELIAAESELGTIRGDITIAQNQLTSSIDGGNTSALVSEIDASTADNATQLRATLMGNSPYLSNEAVKAVAANELAVNNTTLRDVLVSNKKATIDDEVMEVVANRSNSLPSYMYNQIEQAQGTESERDLLEAQIQSHKVNYNFTLANLAEEYISNGNIQKWEELMSNSINADNQYSVAIYSKLNGDETKANAIITTLAAQIGDNEQLQAEHDAYIDYLSIVTNNVVNGVIDDAQKSALTVLSESNTKAGLLSKLILQGAGELTYEEPICIPSGNNMKSSVAAGKKSAVESAPASLHLYPNPAHGSVLVEYNAAGCSEDLMLTITDMKGSIQHSERLQYVEDSKYVNIDKLPRGNYIVNVLSEGNVVYTNKLIIK